MDTILYHGSCPDGWCAAYIAQKRYLGAELVPATYGKPINDADVIDKNVLVVDFSWPRAETERIRGLANSLVILDHHKSAEKELAGLPYALFDMQRSGAQLAWDYCFPFGFDYPMLEPGGLGPMVGDRSASGFERPWFVDYVADRDLWRFELPNSKLINAYLMTLPHYADAWDQIPPEPAQCVNQGMGARAQVDYYVSMVTAEARKGLWLLADWPHGIFTLLVVNAAYPSISDVAHVLCEHGADVGVGWFVRGDGLMQFSLRSIGEIDVAALARLHGGGGHKNAAGFQLPAAEGMSLLRSWGY